MGIDNDKLLDLVNTTLKDLPKDEFETMFDSQHFEFAQIYDRHRVQIDGGTSLERNVMLDRSGTAKYRKLYDTDDLSVENSQKKISEPWVQVGVNYSWDTVEILRNRNSTKGYINLIRSRRHERLWDMAELIEEKGWLAPADSSDTLHPRGIPYFLNMLNAGATVSGFNGQTVRFQDSTTTTTVSGIDGAVEPKWRNYAGTYSKVDNKLLREMRLAFLLTRFKPPASIQSQGRNEVGPIAKIYVADQQAVELQDLADKRDDAARPEDLAGKVRVNESGVISFNRHMIEYIPQLNGVAFNPIYFVDWSKLQPIVQEGYWMVEGKPMMDRRQHTVVTVFLDGSHQNLCINRRTCGWVLHNAIPV